MQPLLESLESRLHLAGQVLHIKDYFPLPAHATWVYSTASGARSITVTDTLLATTRAFGHEKARIIRETGNGPLIMDTFDNFGPDGSVHLHGSSTSGLPVAGGAFTYTPPLKFPASMQTGKNYLTTGKIVQDAAGFHQTGTFKETVRAIGLESVSVPAGKSKALHFRVTIDYTLDGSSHIQVHTVDDVWHRSGVGMVKSLLTGTSKSSINGGTPHVTPLKNTTLLLSTTLHGK